MKEEFYKSWISSRKKSLLTLYISDTCDIPAFFTIPYRKKNLDENFDRSQRTKKHDHLFVFYFV